MPKIAGPIGANREVPDDIKATCKQCGAQCQTNNEGTHIVADLGKVTGRNWQSSTPVWVLMCPSCNTKNLIVYLPPRSKLPDR